jgi:hypothetical protein
MATISKEIEVIFKKKGGTMKKIASCLLILSVIQPMLAHGEYIWLKTKGVVYCPGNKPSRFTPANSTPIFLHLDSATSASAYFGSIKESPDFIVNIQSDAISRTQDSFNLNYYADDFNHVEVIGKITYDKQGFLKSLAGNFIRVGLINNCYAVGTLTGTRF